MSWSYPVTSTRHLLATILVAALAAGCGAEGPEGLPAPGLAAPAGLGAPLRGELVSYIFTFDDGRTDEHYFLRVSNGVPGAASEERRLHFDSPPDVAGGTTLEVWPRSIDGAGEIVVDRIQPLGDRGPLETRQSALINGEAYRPRKIAFVLVDLGAGVNITKEMANQRINGIAAGDRSLRQYYIEASYGRQDIGGEVIGPLRATMQGCNFSSVSQALRPMIPGQYDHYFWYFGGRVAACRFTGVASSGSPERPSRDTWYNGSTSCVVLVQEPGHNFGMMHSSTMRCRTGGQPSIFQDTPQDNCTHSEYGDPYDPMGRACRHMNGYQKAFQGWFGKCNVVEVKSSGTFTINPIELPCDGAQLLQIPMPKMRPFFRSGGGGSSGITTLTHYYVELRAPYGFDQINPAIQPTVQVRASGDIRARNQRGFHTWVLDMNPATPAIEGLATGGSYTDPLGNIKITVESLDARKASVKVEIQGGSGGGPTCMDGAPFTAPGPGIESCAASPAVPGGAPATFPDGGVVMPPADAGNPTTRDAGGDTGGGAPGTGGRSGSEGTGGSGIDNPTSPPGTGGSSPPMDARPPGTGGGGGIATGEAPPTISSGCGCRIGGPEPAAGSSLAALLLGLGLMIRRRVRRR